MRPLVQPPTPFSAIGYRTPAEHDSAYYDSTHDHGEPAADWLRLERDGATYIGSYSLDGSTWHRVGSVELPDVADVQDVGLFASAVNVFRPGVLTAVEYDGFAVTTPTTP